MSLTQEVLVAKHLRMKIFALCLVTNKVVIDSDASTGHSPDEEMNVARINSSTVYRLLERMLMYIPSAW